MNRWFLYGPFALAALFLIVWFFLWRAGAGMMQRTLDDFIAAEAEEGVVVAYDSFKTRGFPFFLRGVVENLSVEDGADRYFVERLYLDALPYAPDRLIFSPHGEAQIISGGDAWTIAMTDARGSVERDKERGWLLKAESGPVSATAGAKTLSLENLLFNMAPAKTAEESFDASLRIADLAFNDGTAGYDFERIESAFTIGAPNSRDRRPVTVHGLQALIEGTEIAGEGTIAVGGGEPATARLDAEIRNAQGLASLIARSPHLEPDEARAAAAGIGMLSVASGGVIRAPIEIDDGEIRIAGVKIAELGQP